jgi:hypothetical protein
VIRVHDNWVRNAPDTTKTSDSEAIPMTPRLARALVKVLDRGYATENEDFVFAQGARQLLLRDKPAARVQWRFQCAIHNLVKLHHNGCLALTTTG